MVSPVTLVVKVNNSESLAKFSLHTFPILKTCLYNLGNANSLYIFRYIVFLDIYMYTHTLYLLWLKIFLFMYFILYSLGRVPTQFLFVYIPATYSVKTNT